MKLPVVLFAMLILAPGSLFGATATTIIPHVAIGSFGGGLTNATILQIINQTTADATVSGEFFGQDGTASDVPFDTTNPGQPAFTGAFGPLVLGPNNSLVITSSPAFTQGRVNWARITADAQITLTTVFEIRDENGDLISRVGVPGSASNLNSFVLPRMRNVDQNIGTAFAVVNTGPDEADVTATLYTGGAQVAQTAFKMGGGTQRAQFVNEALGPLNDPAGTSYSHVVLDSNKPTLGATALVAEGANLATFPLNRLDGSPVSSGTTITDPLGNYTGILLVATRNCSATSDVTNVFLNGQFTVTENAGGIMATGTFEGTESGDQGIVRIEFHAGISGSGGLIGGTFTETTEGFDGGTSIGDGTVTGTIDGTSMDVTFAGTDNWTLTSDPSVQSTCDFIGTFLQP